LVTAQFSNVEVSLSNMTTVNVVSIADSASLISFSSLGPLQPPAGFVSPTMSVNGDNAANILVSAFLVAAVINARNARFTSKGAFSSITVSLQSLPTAGAPLLRSQISVTGNESCLLAAPALLFDGAPNNVTLYEVHLANLFGDIQMTSRNGTAALALLDSSDTETSTTAMQPISTRLRLEGSEGGTTTLRLTGAIVSLLQVRRRRKLVMAAVWTINSVRIIATCTSKAPSNLIESAGGGGSFMLAVSKARIELHTTSSESSAVIEVKRGDAFSACEIAIDVTESTLQLTNALARGGRSSGLSIWTSSMEGQDYFSTAVNLSVSRSTIVVADAAAAYGVVLSVASAKVISVILFNANVTVAEAGEAQPEVVVRTFTAVLVEPPMTSGSHSVRWYELVVSVVGCNITSVVQSVDRGLVPNRRRASSIMLRDNANNIISRVAHPLTQGSAGAVEIGQVSATLDNVRCAGSVMIAAALDPPSAGTSPAETSRQIVVTSVTVLPPLTPNGLASAAAAHLLMGNLTDVSVVIDGVQIQNGTLQLASWSSAAINSTYESLRSLTLQNISVTYKVPSHSSNISALTDAIASDVDLVTTGIFLGEIHLHQVTPIQQSASFHLLRDITVDLACGTPFGCVGVTLGSLVSYQDASVKPHALRFINLDVKVKSVSWPWYSDSFLEPLPQGAARMLHHVLEALDNITNTAPAFLLWRVSAFVALSLSPIFNVTVANGSFVVVHDALTYGEPATFIPLNDRMFLNADDRFPTITAVAIQQESHELLEQPIVVSVTNVTCNIVLQGFVATPDPSWQATSPSWISPVRFVVAGVWLRTASLDTLQFRRCRIGVTVDLVLNTASATLVNTSGIATVSVGELPKKFSILNCYVDTNVQLADAASEGASSTVTSTGIQATVEDMTTAPDDVAVIDVANLTVEVWVLGGSGTTARANGIVFVPRVKSIRDLNIRAHVVAPFVRSVLGLACTLTAVEPVNITVSRVTVSLSVNQSASDSTAQQINGIVWGDGSPFRDNVVIDLINVTMHLTGVLPSYLTMVGMDVAPSVLADLHSSLTISNCHITLVATGTGGVTDGSIGVFRGISVYHHPGSTSNLTLFDNRVAMSLHSAARGTSAVVHAFSITGGFFGHPELCSRLASLMLQRAVIGVNSSGWNASSITGVNIVDPLCKSQLTVEDIDYRLMSLALMSNAHALLSVTSTVRSSYNGTVALTVSNLRSALSVHAVHAAIQPLGTARSATIFLGRGLAAALSATIIDVTTVASIENPFVCVEMHSDAALDLDIERLQCTVRAQPPPAGKQTTSWSAVRVQNGTGELTLLPKRVQLFGVQFALSIAPPVGSNASVASAVLTSILIVETPIAVCSVKRSAVNVLVTGLVTSSTVTAVAVAADNVADLVVRHSWILLALETSQVHHVTCAAASLVTAESVRIGSSIIVCNVSTNTGLLSGNAGLVAGAPNAALARIAILSPSLNNTVELHAPRVASATLLVSPLVPLAGAVATTLIADIDVDLFGLPCSNFTIFPQGHGVTFIPYANVSALSGLVKGTGAPVFAIVSPECVMERPFTRSVSASVSGTSTATRTLTTTPTLSVTQSLSLNDSASATSAVTATVEAFMPTPAPAVLPIPVEQATTAAAATTTVVGALASPAAALQMARVVGVLQIAKSCRSSGGGPALSEYDEELQFPQSLLPMLHFGAARGQYHRGAVLGNAIVAVVLIFAALLLGTFVFALFTKPKSASYSLAELPMSLWQRGRLIVRMPGAITIIVGLGVDGSVTSAVVLALRSRTWGIDAAVIAVSVLINLGALVFVVYSVWTLTRARVDTSSSAEEAGHRITLTRAVYLPVQLIRMGTSEPVFASRRSIANRTASWLLAGDSMFLAGTDLEYAVRRAKLADDPQILSLRNATSSLSDDHLRSCAVECQTALDGLGVVINRYRGPLLRPDSEGRVAAVLTQMAPWSLPIDWFLTITVAACQGIASMNCSKASWIALVANGVGFVYAAIVRPYNVPAKNVILVAMNGLMLAASALTTAAIDADDDDSAMTFTELASRAAAAAAMLGFVAIAFSFVRVVVLRVLLRSTIDVDLVLLQEQLHRRRDDVAPEFAYTTPLLEDPHSMHSDGGGEAMVPSRVDVASDAVEMSDRSGAALVQSPVMQRPEELRDPPTSTPDEFLEELLMDTSASDRVAIEPNDPNAGARDDARRAYYESAPGRRVYRTAEGQRRYADLEAMLSGTQLGRHTSRPSAAADINSTGGIDEHLENLLAGAAFLPNPSGQSMFTDLL
jgi:hypothetical protein